jgi:Flp pilus assembly protein TadD
MMNAKLAMNFDPTVDAYRELFEELTAKKSAPAPKAGPRPQELVLFEQANEAEGRGDYQKAVTLLEQAVALNPKAAALHNKLGVVLSIRLKRHDEALAHLKRAIELEPGSIVYMNNFSKVTGLLESMIQKDPKRERKRGDGKADEKVNIKVKPKRF